MRQLQLLKELRQNVKPVAEGIARSQGISVVLETTDNLIWFDASVDITDEVIAEFRSGSSAALEPADKEGASRSADELKLDQ